MLLRLLPLNTPLMYHSATFTPGEDVLVKVIWAGEQTESLEAIKPAFTLGFTWKLLVFSISQPNWLDAFRLTHLV